MMASAQSAEKLYQQGKALYDAKKYVEAVPKLQAAAEKGHKKAQYRLGYCYDKGRGVKEDDKKAFSWYSKRAGATKKLRVRLKIMSRPWNGLLKPPSRTMPTLSMPSGNATSKGKE